MCIVSAFDYPRAGQTTQYQPVSLRQLFAIPTALPVIQTTVVKASIQAKIMELNRNFGYIQYKLDEHTHQQTLIKNGASSLPTNNGKIFFHEKEVTGPMWDLKVGDTVEFALVHLKRNNKIIAHRVVKTTPEPIDRHAMQLAHVMHMQLPKTVATIVETPKICYIGDNVMGKLLKVVRVNNGTGHAFLESDQFAGQKILMHFSQLIGTDVSVIKIGDAFKFKLFKNNHNQRYIARSCQFIESEVEEAKTTTVTPRIETTSATTTSPAYPYIHALSHSQFMEAPKFTATIEEPKFTPKLKNARGIVIKINKAQKCGFVICDGHTGESTKIFFHESDIVGTITADMETKDIVRFDVVLNNRNKRFVAKNITPELMNIKKRTLEKEQVSVTDSAGMRMAKSFLAGTTGTKPVDYSINGRDMNNKLAQVTLLDSDKRRRSIDTLNSIPRNSNR